jgi:hypothetical protein
MTKLKSHAPSPREVDHIIQEKTAKIIAAGDKSYVTVQEQLDILGQLAEFAFGRFLLQHQGVNGYWTHYMLTHPWKEDSAGLTQLEEFLLERAPLMLATQERFMIFLQENQRLVKNNASLACIPSGMLGELLYLDFSGIDKIKLTGVDYDNSALDDAKTLGEKLGLDEFLTLYQADAWDLPFSNEFDLISSNGLNIYEPDVAKITALYQQFYCSLKAGGKLVTSFVTPMVEWDMSKINQADLLMQKIIFVDVLEAKFQCFCSSEQTKKQLELAGFKDINFIYDQARMFPTVIATKG